MKSAQTSSAPTVPAASRKAARAAAGCLLMAVALPQAGMAAVEYVTRAGECRSVDTVADGDDLTLQAGNNLRFEVWGDGIDVNPAVRVAFDSGNNNVPVTARIIRGYNGAEQRSLWFRMPLGDESRLQTRVVPFPVRVITQVPRSPDRLSTSRSLSASASIFRRG